jgi:outer membrane protein
MADFQTRVTESLNQTSHTHLAPLALVAVIVSVFLAAGWSGDVLAQSKPVTAKPATASAVTEQVGTKVGFVNTQRILLDSAPAKVAQEKIDAEFEKRNAELQKLVGDLRKRVQAFEKDAPVLAESDRNRRQRNEEFAIIIERANAAIKNIAEAENYDLILQDAVTVSPRVDITDKVIKALN